MIEKGNNLSYEMSDTAILALLGSFIRETRLRQNKTQENLAALSGIRRMTLMRIEKGGGGTLATFIRLLRGLQQLHVLSQFVVPVQISPLKLAELVQHKRQRARPSRKNKTGNNPRGD